jgi:hypothetical protein
MRQRCVMALPMKMEEITIKGIPIRERVRIRLYGIRAWIWGGMKAEKRNH